MRIKRIESGEGELNRGGRERKLSYRKTFSIFMLVAFSAVLAAARDLAVVANKGNSVSAISQPDLIKLSKAQTTHWPDGKPVTLVMRAPSSPEMKVFLEKVYGLSESDVSDLIATANHGRANHPAILVATSDDELVNRVASIPGAIGVVDVYSINSSVVVVKLAGKLPLEPGYLLHGN
jgi:ABC-type phosphate transport system substrate-binding protein